MNGEIRGLNEKEKSMLFENSTYKEYTLPKDNRQKLSKWGRPLFPILKTLKETK